MPADHQKVEYPDVRDDFIQRLPKEDTSEVEWLVQVGAFVQHCWLAEENARRQSTDPDKLDELELWHLWDGCSTGQLETLQFEALSKLEEYRKGRTVEALGAYLTRKFQPVGWLAFAIGWLALQLWKGFVSGIGLILLGLLIATVAPRSVEKIHSTFDTILPGTDAAAGTVSAPPTQPVTP